MDKQIEAVIDQVRHLSLPERLALVERLIREIHQDVESQKAFGDELLAWDRLSDEALADFEKGL